VVWLGVAAITRESGQSRQRKNGGYPTEKVDILRQKAISLRMLPPAHLTTSLLADNSSCACVCDMMVRRTTGKLTRSDDDGFLTGAYLLSLAPKLLAVHTEPKQYETTKTEKLDFHVACVMHPLPLWVRHDVYLSCVHSAKSDLQPSRLQASKYR